MRNLYLRILAVVVFVLMTFACRFAAAQTPEVGEMAPDFTLATPAGQSVSLSQLTAKGTVVLVVLRGFPGYQCPFCTKQVHDFAEKADKFAALGAEVLLVYPGPPAALDEHAKEFLAMQKPLPGNVHLVIDPDYKFTNQYGLRWDAAQETAYPSTFVLGKGGVVKYRKISHEHGGRTGAADVLAEIQSGK